MSQVVIALPSPPYRNRCISAQRLDLRVVAATTRPLAEAREDLERTMVRDTLGRLDSVARAVGELAITRQGLSRLMARLQIDRFDPTHERGALTPCR